MHKMFYPASVAVIGVSEAPGNLGKHIIGNLRDFGFRGRIFAVGQQSGMVHDIEILTAVSSLPEQVDLAAIITPAKTIPLLLRQCGEKGILRAAILSAGFTELSDGRESLQREVLDAAEQFGIRFVGPNCLGLICTENGLVLPFAKMTKEAIAPGYCSVLAQSGGVANSLSYIASQEGVGIAKYVSMGNKLNIDEVDLLPYLMEDPQTRVTCIYLEGLTRGRELVELARSAPKPIAILKGNTSELTHRAAKSHTASLATDDRLVDGAFRQAGITRVRTMRDGIVAARALTLPPLRGERIAGVASSGGFSVLGADACHEFGFELPDLPRSLLQDLTDRARAGVIALGNPIDLGDIFDRKVAVWTIEQVLSLPEIDGAFFALSHNPHGDIRSGSDPNELVPAVAEISRRLQKPVAVNLVCEPWIADDYKRQIDFPIFSTVEEAIAGLRMLRDYTRSRSVPLGHNSGLPADRARADEAIASIRSGERDGSVAAIELLEAYGLPMAKWGFAKEPEEATKIAERLGFPVTLKAIAQGVIHKSDVGGVLLDLPDKAAVLQAYQTVRDNLARRAPEATLHGVLVQRYVPGGMELILGAKRDDSFGPVVMFGIGGIFAEVLEEVAFRLAPLSREDATDLVWQVRGAKILKGVRGNPPADVDAIVDAICRLGQLIADHPEIAEIDVNPIKVFGQGQGAIAVDARIALA